MKTTNFEISKKLKEIGFEAEFNFHYKATDPVNLYDSGYEDYKERNTPSYDLETLIGALPKDISVKHKYYIQFLFIQLADGPIKIGYYEPCTEYQGHYDMREDVFESRQEETESLADTAGKMLIKLFEAGIINFNK